MTNYHLKKKYILYKFKKFYKEFDKICSKLSIEIENFCCEINKNNFKFLKKHFLNYYLEYILILSILICIKCFFIKNNKLNQMPKFNKISNLKNPTQKYNNSNIYNNIPKVDNMIPDFKNIMPDFKNIMSSFNDITLDIENNIPNILNIPNIPNSELNTRAGLSTSLNKDNVISTKNNNGFIFNDEIIDIGRDLYLNGNLVINIGDKKN